jgi:hypothetical protein
MKYFNDVSELFLSLQKLGYVFDTYDPKTNLARYVKMVASEAIVFMVFEQNELVDYDFALFGTKKSHSGFMERCYTTLEEDLKRLKEMQ